MKLRYVAAFIILVGGSLTAIWNSSAPPSLRDETDPAVDYLNGNAADSTVEFKSSYFDYEGEYLHAFVFSIGELSIGKVCAPKVSMKVTFTVWREAHTFDESNSFIGSHVHVHVVLPPSYSATHLSIANIHRKASVDGLPLILPDEVFKRSEVRICSLAASYITFSFSFIRVMATSSSTLMGSIPFGSDTNFLPNLT